MHLRQYHRSRRRVCYMNRAHFTSSFLKSLGLARLTGSLKCQLDGGCIVALLKFSPYVIDLVAIILTSYAATSALIVSLTLFVIVNVSVGSTAGCFAYDRIQNSEELPTS
jgi:hypothetical protein